MIAPAFGGYAQFGPQPTVLSPRGPHHAAFYPHPILYWSYPSPPVSPTTYYGPASHPAHIAPAMGPQHQPTLVRVFILIFGIE